MAVKDSNPFVTETVKSNTNISLLWCQWSNSLLIAYLNPKDCDRKSEYSEREMLPWFQIPYTEDKMVDYCKRNTFKTYKSYIFNLISASKPGLITDLIKKLLRVCKLYELNAYEATTLYYEVLHCLFDQSCSDTDLLLNVWNTFCSNSDEVKVAVFKNLIRYYHEKKYENLLKYILNIAQSAYFDFWGAWKKSQLENFSFCPVTSALLQGSVEQMTILLQYGFEQNSQRLFTYDEDFISSMNDSYSWLKQPLEGSDPGRHAILTEVFLFLTKIAPCRSKSRRKRLTKCFHLLWDTVSVPFVTEAELQAEIEDRFKNPPSSLRQNSFPCTPKYFARLCDVYYDILPVGATDVVQPRSLLHLCKCTVRNSLHKAWNLPNGIHSLGLPREMQSYLSI